MKEIAEIKSDKKIYSETELIEIANLEKKLKNALKENNKKGFCSQGITEEEADMLIEWVVQRDRQLIAMYSGEFLEDFDDINLQGCCKLSQSIVHKFLTNMGLNPRCTTISSVIKNYIGSDDHKFNSVELPITNSNLETKEKNFLIDVTYRQFFLDEITLPGYWCIHIPGGCEFSELLLRQGYIELSKENAKIYGDSFFLSSMAYQKIFIEGKRHFLTEELFSNITGEQYLENFTALSKQDSIAMYDNSYLQYYFGIEENELKTPLMQMALGRNTDEELER